MVDAKHSFWLLSCLTLLLGKESNLVNYSEKIFVALSHKKYQLF
jgi:hypothetical protein